MSAQTAAFEFVKKLAAELSAREFELPPFPETALRIRRALDDPQVNVESIGRVLPLEPVLCARLLRLANSSMLRRGALEVTDPRLAVSRLGLDMVRNTVTAFAMDTSFPVPPAGELRRHVESTRRHCAQVASLGYLLAQRSQCGVPPDDALLAGLLHDIGRFYILTRVRSFPELFADRDALGSLMHDWHAGVGRAIVDAWGFPESVAIAVDEHADLERDPSRRPDLTDVVLVANVLANRGNPDHPEPPPFTQIPAFRKLGLDVRACADLITESEDELRSMASALGG